MQVFMVTGLYSFESNIQSNFDLVNFDALNWANYYLPSISRYDRQTYNSVVWFSIYSVLC